MSTDTRLYNLLHTGNPGDCAYYVKHCPKGATVLELGSGSGRIAARLHQNGCIVEGLDNDLHMLQAFAQTMSVFDSPPRCHAGDMRTFQLNRQFDRIIIPFNGLLCMLSLADVERVLTQVRTHLHHDGELIFDIYYVPDDFENDGIEEDSYIDTAVLDDNGTRIEVYEKTLCTEDPQRFDTSYIFVAHPNTSQEKQFEHTILQRCLYLYQLEQCLANAGLCIRMITGNFSKAVTRDAIGDDIEQLVIHAIHCS